VSFVDTSRELRFVRSIVATTTFFATGVITAHIFHNNLETTVPLDWSFGATACNLLAAQIVPFAVSILLYFVVSDELFILIGFGLTALVTAFTKAFAAANWNNLRCRNTAEGAICRVSTPAPSSSSCLLHHNYSIWACCSSLRPYKSQSCLTVLALTIQRSI
jgi:hypothetical protein